MTVACPTCRRGRVVRARYRRTGGVVLLCEACDALWFDAAAVGGLHVLSQTAYRRAHELTDERFELEWIEPDWSGLIDRERWRSDPDPHRVGTEFLDPLA